MDAHSAGYDFDHGAAVPMLPLSNAQALRASARVLELPFTSRSPFAVPNSKAYHLQYKSQLVRANHEAVEGAKTAG
jgi:hypothetical protein